MNLIIPLLTVHIIADFGLRDETEGQRQNLILHALFHLLLLIPLLYAFYSPILVLLFLILVLSHILIDYFNLSHVYKGKNLEGFILDQVMHLLVILAVYFLAGDIHSNSELFNNAKFQEALLYISALVFSARGGTQIVRGILGKFPRIEEGESPAVLKMGRMIGNLERLFVLVLLFLGQYSGILFVLTAKSIVRFKDFDKRYFAEYFLIGTLTSYLVALILYVAVILAKKHIAPS